MKKDKDYEVCISKLLGSCSHCVVGPHNRNCHSFRGSGFCKTGIDRDGIMVIRPISQEQNEADTKK